MEDLLIFGPVNTNKLNKSNQQTEHTLLFKIDRKMKEGSESEIM